MILALYFLGALVVFSMGLAAFFAALQVYFRDTANFLPYFVRIWMYLSPVLWLPEAIARLPRADRDDHQDQPDVLDAGWLYGADPGGHDSRSLHVAELGRLGLGGRGDRLLVLHFQGA